MEQPERKCPFQGLSTTRARRDGPAVQGEVGLAPSPVRLLRRFLAAYRRRSGYGLSLGLVLGPLVAGCAKPAVAPPEPAAKRPSAALLRDAAEEAARRGDYAFAIAVFEQLGERKRRDELVAQRQAAGRATPPPETPPPSRLAVRANVLSAEVSVDGAEPAPAPRFLALAAGGHEITVRAQGYETIVRLVVLREGEVSLLDAEMIEAPALLILDDVIDEASVYVDGTFAGATPLDKPISLEGGRHRVVVAAVGHEPFRTQVVIERGEARRLTPDLPLTPQRIWAISSLTVGGLAIGTSVVTGIYGSLRAEPPASRASAATGAIGFVLSLTGGALFIFDPPDIDVGPGPGDAGLSFRVRF